MKLCQSEKRKTSGPDRGMDISQTMYDAFIYTFPVYEMARTRHNALHNPARPVQGVTNQLLHRRDLSDHTSRTVTTPNNDTLYSSAWLDVADGPVTVRVPAIAGRYWSLHFMDMFSNTVELLGCANMHDGDISLRVCHRSDPSETPSGQQTVCLPGVDAWLLIRVEVRSDADLIAVRAIQDQFQIARVVTPGGTLRQHRVAPHSMLDGANYLAVVNEVLAINGVPESDHDMLLAWREFGIDPSNATTAIDIPDLWTGQLPRFRELLKAAEPLGTEGLGGWHRPQWDEVLFGDHYELRAAIALKGIGALPTHEAVYMTADLDLHGEAGSPSKNYRVMIPSGGISCKSFWSISVYQVEADGRLYFVQNGRRRYSIGNRSTDLMPEEDGRIEICLQSEEPLDHKAKQNWLPAPGPEYPTMRLVLRAYLPTSDLISGTAELPVITCVSG